MRLFLFAALVIFTASTAARAEVHAAANPPAEITREEYRNWLTQIGSAVSPFHDKMYDWYEAQLVSPLPPATFTDPEKIFINVADPMQETIDMEASGEIEEGNTVGFNAYAIIDAPVSVALQTKLFTWGKPLGQREGETWPFDTVFKKRHDWLTEKWGPGNYYSGGEHTNGGIVKDLRDDYTLLVRGNETDGYVVLAGFFAVNGRSPTLSHISFVFFKPTADGKTELRQSVRQQGQSYKVFGLEYGRKNFGFNGVRVREGEKGFINTVLELKTTGTIKENKPKKEELPN